MDLRIDRLRNELIQKINSTNDEEKLDNLLSQLEEDDNDLELSTESKARYIERTQLALKSAKEDRLYTMEEVRNHFGIRGRK